MADYATPLLHIMRNNRMSAERLWHRRIAKAGLCDALMTSSAAINYAHFGQPYLIDARMIICQKPFRVRPRLRVGDVVFLVSLPTLEKVLNRRSRKHHYESHACQRERGAQPIWNLSQLLCCHIISTARPTTIPGPGKEFQPP